jgi:hypothetical protein
MALPKNFPKTKDELEAEITKLIDYAKDKKLPIKAIGLGPELGKLLNISDDIGPLPGIKAVVKDSEGNSYPIELFGDIYGPCVMS